MNQELFIAGSRLRIRHSDLHLSKPVGLDLARGVELPCSVFSLSQRLVDKTKLVMSYAFRVVIKSKCQFLAGAFVVLRKIHGLAELFMRSPQVGLKRDSLGEIFDGFGAFVEANRPDEIASPTQQPGVIGV